VGQFSRALQAQVHATIEALLPGVAATLLRPGMTFELHQLRHQLIRAVETLAQLLRRSGLTVGGVEEELAAEWLGAKIAGRLDLRLQDSAGQDVILDLKWGNSTYRERLGEGRAVQLAVYAQARRLLAGRPALPPAGYFSLSRGTLLTTEPAAFAATAAVDGPSLDATVRSIATTLPAIQNSLAIGLVPVTGVGRSLPLLDTLHVAAADRARHYAAAPGKGCDYCSFGPLCGRAWEALA